MIGLRQSDAMTCCRAVDPSKGWRGSSCRLAGTHDRPKRSSESDFDSGESSNTDGWLRRRLTSGAPARAPRRLRLPQRRGFGLKR
jgi:hypothetical protein